MMDQQNSEPITLSTVVYDSDGSVVMKQEPQNDSSQVDAADDCDLNENVINIAPIMGNQTGICKIEDVHTIKNEPHENWCELSENYQPAVKRETVKLENDLGVCDGHQDSKLTNGNVTLKTESIQTDDGTSQPVEVSGAIDCKDNIISNVTAGICVGRVNQSDEEQSDAAQQQPPCHLESTDGIKREGMCIYII